MIRKNDKISIDAIKALECLKKDDPDNDSFFSIEEYLKSLSKQLGENEEMIRVLQEELEESNRGMVALTLELENELQKRMEAEINLLNANKELEAFTYSVSHDLRAPLRHIEGFAELLQKRIYETLGEKEKHFFDRITESANYMGKLIDELLILSRVERKELKKEIFDSGNLVKEIIDELSREIKKRNINWEIDDLPRIEADKTLIKQVFVNLISNAVKYTSKNEKASIKISCEKEEKKLIFCVQDNGVGFDMAQYDKLFTVFQRLHRSDEFEGIGIGLANVKRIINKHGGKAWAEGEIGKGAKFYFSLYSLESIV